MQDFITPPALCVDKCRWEPVPRFCCLKTQRRCESQDWVSRAERRLWLSTNAMFLTSFKTNIWLAAVPKLCGALFFFLSLFFFLLKDRERRERERERWQFESIRGDGAIPTAVLLLLSLCYFLCAALSSYISCASFRVCCTPIPWA